MEAAFRLARDTLCKCRVAMAQGRQCAGRPHNPLAASAAIALLLLRKVTLTEMKLMGRWPHSRASMNTRKGTPTIGEARFTTQEGKMGAVRINRL